MKALTLYGWKISVCNHSLSPIILVTFEKNENCVRSRFDIDKQMFIDHTPVLLTIEEKSLIAKKAKNANKKNYIRRVFDIITDVVFGAGTR